MLWRLPYSGYLTTPSHVAATLHHRAIAAWQRGEAVAAVDLLRQAADADPRWPVAANDLGALLAQLGRTAEAIPQFRRAIALAPAYPELITIWRTSSR